MQLKATCQMTVTAATPTPLIAMLRPRRSANQWAVSETFETQPPVDMLPYIDSYGNHCQRMVLPAGETAIDVELVMNVDDHIAVAPDAPWTPIDQLPDDALLFLLPSRYCPSDKMADKAKEVVGDAPRGYAQVERIRAWIHANLEYRYGVSDATTDAQDTLAHGAGVCRDFSHVGMALCRALRIPARMAVGYLHQLDPMDLHAWFEAYVGGQWYTFDATQSAPRGGRIVLAYGRDAADVAFISDYAEQSLEMGEMNVAVSLVEESQAPAPAMA